MGEDRQKCSTFQHRHWIGLSDTFEGNCGVAIGP